MRRSRLKRKQGWRRQEFLRREAGRNACPGKSAEVSVEYLEARFEHDL